MKATMKTIAAAALLGTMLGGCATGRTPIESLREQGDWEFKRGHYADAALQYQQIVDRYPGDWEGQYQLGLSRLAMNEPTPARQALEIAHTRRPHDEDISDALAKALHAAGSEAQLFAFLRERTEVDATMRSYLRLARYSTEIGDPDSARAALDHAIEMDGGNRVEPYLAAAELAEQVGDREEAVRRLRQACWIDPRDKRVAQRLRDLGEVPGLSIALPPGR